MFSGVGSPARTPSPRYSIGTIWLSADAKRLPKLLDGIPAKLNLLPYNPCRADQPDLLRPDDAAVEGFAEALRRKGINTTVRKSRGLDIDAACGQLVLQNPPRAARAPAQGAASS